MVFAISGNWTNWFISLIIVVWFIGLAFTSRYILRLVGQSLARITRTILDDIKNKVFISHIRSMSLCLVINY
jgi:hypothetical protein